MWKNEYLHVIKSSKDRILLDDQDLVYEYFRLISSRDVRHLRNLFTEDAVIHDPFTKGGYRVINLDPFVLAMMRIYDFMHYRPAYEKPDTKWYIDSYYDENQRSVTSALGTVEEIRILFTFKFGYDCRDNSHSRNRRIEFLHIQTIQ